MAPPCSGKAPPPNTAPVRVYIKIRGGRTYEFTDPSGKADALYLFHQEVDKVRQRMK